GGASNRLPLTLFTFRLAGVTPMGFPPASRCLAKWLLIDSALVSGKWGWILVLIAGALLTAAYAFKLLRHAFVKAEPNTLFKPLPRMLEWPAFLLAAAALLLGLRATEMLDLLVLP